MAVSSFISFHVLGKLYKSSIQNSLEEKWRSEVYEELS